MGGRGGRGRARAGAAPPGLGGDAMVMGARVAQPAPTSSGCGLRQPEGPPSPRPHGAEAESSAAGGHCEVLPPISAAELLRGVIGEADEVIEYLLDQLGHRDSEGSDGPAALDEDALADAVVMLEAHQSAASLAAGDDMRTVALTAASLLAAEMAELAVGARASRGGDAPMECVGADRAGAAVTETGARAAGDGWHERASPSAASAADRAQDARVVEVRSIVPEASEALCAYALSLCGGQCNEAAEMLISDTEAGGLGARELERQRAEAAVEEERAAELSGEARGRQRAVMRNDAVRDHRADGEKPPPIGPPRLPYSEKRKGERQLRYLDGQVVAQKGERHVTVASSREEWDGGSRGRVKSKGKRGPGYQ